MQDMWLGVKRKNKNNKLIKEKTLNKYVRKSPNFLDIQTHNKHFLDFYLDKKKIK